jgi:hypothetical protein
MGHKPPLLWNVETEFTLSFGTSPDSRFQDPHRETVFGVREKATTAFHGRPNETNAETAWHRYQQFWCN